MSRIFTFAAAGLFMMVAFSVQAQGIYTAEGYLNETKQETYAALKKKLDNGDSIFSDERAYLADFEKYLENYFSRLTEEEKQRYKELISQPGNLPAIDEQPREEEFEWRNRDRFLNVLYGSYYGATLLVLADANSAGAAGIPLVAGGLSLLGPAINPRKYEGITQSTIRASNSGKFIGLGYGAALGLALGGESESTLDLVMGLSSLGSMVLGEAAFQIQKRDKTPDGKIELMRHYGIVGPAVGLSLFGATGGGNANLGGVSILAGGVAGLALGRNAYNRYNYSRGDVNVINSMAFISTAIGLTVVISALENSDNPNGLVLIPAAGAIAGTLIGQRNVRNLHFTSKQGSTLALASTGAELVGLGIMGLAQADSPTAIVAVPAVLGLIMHQIMFSKYKKENLLGTLKGGVSRAKKSWFALQVKPESYFLNKQIPASRALLFGMNTSNPIVNLTWRWK